MVSAGAVIVLAGCSSGVPGVPQRAAAPLSVGCSASVVAGKLLAAQRPVTMPVPGRPTAVVGTADGRWAFASVSTGTGGEIWKAPPFPDCGNGGAFHPLRGDPSRALQAVVRVGSEPVGLLLVDDGRLALVGNSNRGPVPGTGSDVRQTVSVINTAAALAHRSAVLGVVPTGLFPRDLTFDQATGQVLLGNFNSSTIEEFPVPKAP